MDNEELIEYIENITNLLDPRNPLLYEVAFLKIYVKFEKYLSAIFKLYCLGESSISGYQPERKLNFTSENQLRAFLSSENKSYIEYLKKIEKLSSHIFSDNPFSIIYETSNVTLFNQMQSLRNHIAHESDESKKKYKEMCLANSEFIEAGEYLLKNNRRNSKTYYTIYIEKIKEIANYIIKK